MSPDPYDGSMDLGNPQSLNRYSYVGNNPLGFTDPSGLEGGGVSAPACWTAIAQGGANPGADIGCGVGLLVDYLFISSFFNHPKFHGSTSPRPNAHIWDEHEFSYGANPGGALGLPGSGCDFGSCGGSVGSFASGGGGDPTTQIKSLYDNILEHLAKLEGDPLNPAAPHWKGEVQNWSKQILKKAGRRPGSLDKYLQRIIGITGSDLENLFPSPIIIVNPCVANPLAPYCSRSTNGPA